MSQLAKIKVANLSDKNSCPKLIKIKKENYFLTFSELKGFTLFSSECPHMGGKVLLKEDCFICPVHFWKFDHQSGESLNIENQPLKQISLFEENDALFVYEKDLMKKNMNTKRHVDQWVNDLKCKLHAHACIEFNYKETRILTDPWLEGPAFLGSWYHYPEIQIESKNIDVDYIIITHEHSDHFHLPTLEKINKSIPVIIPDFPNQRMEKSLKDIGFLNIIKLHFGQEMVIKNDLKITIFEPKGVWNDSIVLFKFGDFKWLNLNDAGINQNLIEKVYPVDVVSSTFSFGASGYPLTWKSISEDDADLFMIKSNQGRIEQIKHAMNIYGAKYFVPFASHITFCHPTQIQFLEKIKRNNVFDIKENLKNEPFKVIDWFPGDEWEVETLKLTRYKKHSRNIYDKNALKEFATEQYKENHFNDYFENIDDIFLEEKTRDYFLNFNNSPQIKLCEDVVVMFNLTDLNYQIINTFYIEVKNSKLNYNADKNIQNLHIQIDIPRIIFNKLIADDLSWDEAFVGYWCRFFRTTDEYKIGFWRLLQAPYYKKHDQQLKNNQQLLSLPIENMIDIYGDNAIRVLNRFGLYCNSCEFAFSETLDLAMNKHGLSESQKNQLVNEIIF